MSYQVIARKWRPQSFTELVGQNHVSQTLVNALRSGRLHHALLFTGPRGTGKTSTARILAKSIRCPNAKDFVPCHECAVCQDIAHGRSIDVVEIDGASNNGVDAIRELRDTVGYMPSTGKYKLYIIDEVHMLSTSAFNALLKTLEEPPEHVIFVMATTEVQKIPQTILSRCQRYDFRRISTKQITERLKLICDNEGVKAVDDALWMIARQGDGSMRDSQSLLDQVITFAGGDLTFEKVVEILGLTDRKLLSDTLEMLCARNTQGLLPLIEKIFQSGYDSHMFSQDLLELIRNLLFVKISSREKAPELLEMPDSEIDNLSRLAGTLSEEDIHLLFDMALKGASDIARASDPRIVLEMLLLRMAAAPKIASLAQLLKGGGQISTPASASAATVSIPVMKSPIKNYAPTTNQESLQRQPLNPAPAAAAAAPPKVKPESNETGWVSFVSFVKQKEPLFGAKLENVLFNGFSNKTLGLGVPAKMQFLKGQMTEPQTQKKLQSYIDQFWGPGYAIEIKVMAESGNAVSAQALVKKMEDTKQEQIRDELEQHPLVKSAQNVFKGQIKSIKETN